MWMRAQQLAHEQHAGLSLVLGETTKAGDMAEAMHARDGLADNLKRTLGDDSAGRRLLLEVAHSRAETRQKRLQDVHVFGPHALPIGLFDKGLPLRVIQTGRVVEVVRDPQCVDLWCHRAASSLLGLGRFVELAATA